MNRCEQELAQLKNYQAILQENLQKLAEELGRLSKNNNHDDIFVLVVSRRMIEIIMQEICKDIGLDCQNNMVGTMLSKFREKSNKIIPNIVPSNVYLAMEFINGLSLPGAHVNPYDSDDIKLVLTSLEKVLRWYVVTYKKWGEPNPNLTGFENLSGLSKKSPPEISRLPHPSTKLVGRIEELEDLKNALLDKNKNIAYICAAGGIGKSALTFQWLKTMQPDYLGIEKVFAWSFYSQGSHDTQNSSTAFFQEALPFFGFNGEMPKDDTAKGRLLVKYLNNQSFILILDGLEPLQHRVTILDGELKDMGIRAFIDELFYHGLKAEKSLVLISSRQPLAELESWDEEKYLKIDLQTLNKKEGAILLKKLGVKGTTEGLEQEELEQTSEEWGGHALALVLLGKLLKNKFVGKVRFRNRLPALWTADRFGGHALRILRFYEQQWSNNSHEYIFMVLMSLFDRPMGISEKRILVEKAEIAAPLQNLDEIAWEQLEITLESSGLLLSCDSPRIHWDCHPLIREYFCEQFKTIHFYLFQQAHLVLFEFYQQLPEKNQPDTLEELAPLYRAVVHGCLAGEHLIARNLYWKRIRRGNEGYSTHKLGLYSEDLTALAAFFPQGWTCSTVQSLSEGHQAWLLGTISFCLMSLGRLEEATEPRKMHLSIRIKKEEWKKSANSARNLTDLMVFLGKLNEAADFAEQSIYYANKTDNLYEKLKSYVRFADVCYHCAKFSTAEQYFKKAKQLQMQRQPKKTELYSLSGFLYFSWLLEQDISKSEYNLILEQQKKNLSWYIDSNEDWLLSIAFDSLIIARTYVKLNQLELAGIFFEQSVDGIRKAKRNNNLPEFLLGRANFFIKINKLEEAKRDLEEAKQLISRSGMKLYEVDYHLAMCRFFHLTKEKDSFDKHLSVAKKQIDAIGYHLRDKSVLELKNLTF